jgi:hypothetical protein
MAKCKVWITLFLMEFVEVDDRRFRWIQGGSKTQSFSKM